MARIPPWGRHVVLIHVVALLLWFSGDSLVMATTSGSFGAVFLFATTTQPIEAFVTPSSHFFSNRITTLAEVTKTPTETPTSKTDQLLKRADSVLSWSAISPEAPGSRRLWMASLLGTAGTAIAASPAGAVVDDSNDAAFRQASKLQNWKTTPVNKRTGVTVFDVEKDGYNVRFVTYLSRFLLSFDPPCQKWWYNRAADIPYMATADEVREKRFEQFAAFSASVEVGLQEYRANNDGPERLLKSLLDRYGQQSEVATMSQSQQQQPSSDSDARRVRLTAEAKRQIALLFGLMEENQPVDALNRLLASIDNGSIAAIQVLDGGAGYAPGYGVPAVEFPQPKAGPDFEKAQGRAVLSPNGRLLRIDLVNRGAGYVKPPIVTIDPPRAMNYATVANDRGKYSQPVQAQAQAFLFKQGVNKGRIERVQLTNPGAGYTREETIKIRLSPPALSYKKGGVTATAVAVLEYEVTDVLIVNNGTGYAVEKPIQVYVEPPPLTARVNMNDPVMARIVPEGQPLPATTVPNARLKAKMPAPTDPSSITARATAAATRGGGGGCVGRACYDRPVEVIAFPRAERDVFTAYRTDDDVNSIRGIEKAALRNMLARSRVVSGSVSTSDAPMTDTLIGGEGSSTAELLSLFPSGIGLEYNNEKGRYEVASDPNYQNDIPTLRQAMRVDFDFGPRGRSPIERDRELGIETYLRFVASGAICCSAVHLALTPIDVVKTKVQTDPKKYPGIVGGFKKVLEEGGPSGFFTGWAPTFFGFLCWGGVSYALTEYFRRALIASAAGFQLTGFDVVIVLTSAALAAFVGSFVIAPFEAVRIRSVFQKNYAPNIVAVYKRMVKEEGLPSLFSAVPVMLAKEIPFACAKFTVFDLSTSYLYNLLPAAREDIQLSLAVSLAGGLLGGIVAAIVSNPADVTVSQMKMAKSKVAPLEMAETIVTKGGAAALFTGLPLRLVFYMLLVSLQFLIYDAVRIALGVGADDLKLYLDVLGEALAEGAQVAT